MEKLKTRLIFLDIDGVLNSLRTYAAYGKYPCWNKESWGGYNEPKTLKVKEIEWFDKTAIALVNQLAKVTDAGIVLSSSWREGLCPEECEELLAMIGIDSLRFIGKTDSLGNSRGEEIARFVKAYYTDIAELRKQGLITEDILGEFEEPTIVILDDLNVGVGKENQILVNPREGLSLDNAIDAARILMNDSAFTLRNFMGFAAIGQDKYLGVFASK